MFSHPDEFGNNFLLSFFKGDSGGPLVLQGSDGRWTEVGIVSFGSIEGCEVGAPVGFTRVTTHLDWIATTTGLRV